MVNDIELNHFKRLFKLYVDADGWQAVKAHAVLEHFLSELRKKYREKKLNDDA